MGDEGAVERGEREAREMIGFVAAASRPKTIVHLRAQARERESRAPD